MEEWLIDRFKNVQFSVISLKYYKSLSFLQLIVYFSGVGFRCVVYSSDICDRRVILEAN
jgi:hypothetical protein